jgi:D-arginine dehydrogenase
MIGAMDVDVVIVGGGIAGMSCAAFLAPRTSVAVLEMETTLGYHATGRSAALYTECYGAEPVRRMSLASKSYFVDREPPFGTPRGVLFLAPSDDRSSLNEFYQTFSALVPDLEVLSPAEVSDLVSVIPAEMTSGGVLEPEALDLDVHTILTSYASTVRAHDGAILTASRAIAVERLEGRWRITAGEHVITASTLVNAAGAWGDELATIAGLDRIGLTPLKRSAFTFDPGVPVGDWPVVVEMGETWYMKPEGPYLLGSAASEIPQEPSDARHDEIDIALGIERITAATTMTIRSVKNQWAGLRTFTPDRIPAVGRDPAAPDFFWLVGQGGYGVHTSPAMASMAAGLILDNRVPEDVAEFGVTSEMLDPARFRR